MRTKIILFSLLFLGFVNGVQHTIITASLSIFGEQFDAMAYIGWFSVSASITSIAVAPIIGYYANFKRLKPLFRFGFFLMIIGFLVSITSDTFTQLLIGRAIAGIGTGTLSILPSVFVTKYLSFEKRTQVDAYQFACYTAGTFIGPLIGSFLTHQLGWQGIFSISIALFSLLWLSLELGWVSLKETREQTKKKDASFIWQNTLFMSFLLGILLVVEIATETYKEPYFYALLTLSFLSLYGYMQFSKRSDTPLFHPQLIKNRIFLAVIIYSFIFGFSKFIFINFIPIYVMDVLNESYLFANYTLTAILIGNAIGNIVTAKLVRKIIYKRIFIASLVLQHVNLALLMLGDLHHGLFLLGLSFLIGLANGFAGYPGLLVLQYSFPQFTGSAASSNNMSRHFGGVIGIVIFQQIALSGSGATMSSFQNGFLSLWILFALLSLIIFLLPTVRLSEVKRNES